MQVKYMIEHLQKYDPESYLQFDVVGKTVQMTIQRVPQSMPETRHFPVVVNDRMGYPAGAAEVDRFICQCEKPHEVTMLDGVWYPKGTKICGNCNKPISEGAK